MKIAVSHGFIEICKGNIADQDTDAVVNAANNMLWMGAGVAGAIKRQGGEIIEKEAMAQGPVDLGGIVMTTAGKLKSKHVIHAAVMGQDLHTTANIIQSATRNALDFSERHGITSISVPALGTGVGGFSIFHCAKIMLTEAIECLIRSKTLKLIRFVLYDDEAFSAFEQELKLQFSTKRH
ncbi:MAG: macro domain-containing protein [Bacteroidota bacterium]